MTAPSSDDTRAVRRWALIGTAVLVLLVLMDVQRLGGNPLGLVQPGAEGPAVAVFHEDFPDVELPDGMGLDGQMAYAIARDPIPVDAAADHLDRPRYRLQRPLLPFLAATLHPTGGGMGLVWALFAVGLAGVAAAAVGAGSLSVRWGGPAWVGAVVAVLPGCFMSLRVTTSDALGMGLALLAVALAARGRHGVAVALGVAAVLAKEPAWLVLAGWALAHRTRRDAALAVVPAVVAGAWMLTLRLTISGTESLNGDIGLPFVGLVRAATDLWADGQESWGLVGITSSLVVGTLAIVRRGLRHPLGWAIALNLTYVVVAGSNPLGTSFGGTRTGLALTALGVIALATPHAPPVGRGSRADGAAPSVDAGAPTPRQTASPTPQVVSVGS